MTDIRSKLHTLYSLEQLAGGDSCIHRVHPLAKLAVTACCLLCVASMGRYSFFTMVPFVFYPAIVLALADIPFGMVLRRALVALPLCLFAGVSNLLLERQPAFYLGAVPVSAGALSLCTILLRTFLCVSAVLILAAVTPLTVLTAQLRRLHVPWVFLTLFEMIYRYIGTLMCEAAEMRTAYLLRRGTHTGIPLGDAGVLIGQLFLRSYSRAARIYAAMQCRGYAARAPRTTPRTFTGGDWCFLLGCCVPMLAVRLDAAARLAALWKGGL